MSVIHIDAETRRLIELLDLVDSGHVVLPDFQRDFDWSPTNVRSLLATLLLGWPSGSLLFARFDPSHADDLSPRPFETVSSIAERPSFVVLDGQQRLTSLYLALRDRGGYRYALRSGINLNSPPSRDELEDAILAISEEQWLQQYPTPRDQIASALVPFSALRSPSHFFKWREEAVGGIPDQDHAWERLTDLYRLVLARITEYVYPVTVVGQDVPAPTLAGIFEVTNRTGLKLGTFDLMVARISTRDWSLREAWNEAADSSPALTEWLGEDATAILQAIALFDRGDVRQSAVLRLTTADISMRWSQAVAGMERALAFLNISCGAPGSAYVPYGVMVPALAALFMNEGSVDEKALTRWYFSTSFGLKYDAASNTRVVADYNRLRESGTSDTREELQLDPKVLAEATRKSHAALWRGLVCATNLHMGTVAGPAFTAAKDVAPRSVFGQVDPQQLENAPHLRALSYALFRTGRAAARDRIALLDDAASKKAQLIPQSIPSVSEGASSFETFFESRAQLIVSFLTRRFS